MVVAAAVVAATASTTPGLASGQRAGGERPQRIAGIARGSGHHFDAVGTEPVHGTSTDAADKNGAHPKLSDEVWHPATLALSWRGHGGSGKDLAARQLCHDEKGGRPR